MTRRNERGMSPKPITGDPEKLTQEYARLKDMGYRLDSVLYFPLPQPDGAYADEIDEQCAAYAAAVYDGLVEQYYKRNVKIMQAPPQVSNEHLLYGPNVFALMLNMRGCAELKLHNASS